MKFRYPVSLQGESGGYVVTFPDFPEAFTQGDDLEEAIANASDCLDEAVAARIFEGDEIPAPSRVVKHGVELSADIALKAALYLSFKQSGWKRTELARELEVAENEVRRMLNPFHATKLSRLDDALRVLGKRVRVELVDI